MNINGSSKVKFASITGFHIGAWGRNFMKVESELVMKEPFMVGRWKGEKVVGKTCKWDMKGTNVEKWNEQFKLEKGKKYWGV